MPFSETSIVKFPDFEHMPRIVFLSYVPTQTQMARLIMREECSTAQMRISKRFAIHNLAIFLPFANRDAEVDRDISQVSVFLAGFGEMYLSTIESAINDLPIFAQQYLVGAAPAFCYLIQFQQREFEEFADVIAQIAT